MLPRYLPTVSLLYPVNTARVCASWLGTVSTRLHGSPRPGPEIARVTVEKSGVDCSECGYSDTGLRYKYSIYQELELEDQLTRFVF